MGEGPRAGPPPEPPLHPPGAGPLPPPQSPCPSPSFEYALLDPGSALLRPSPTPYANLRPLPKGAGPPRGCHAPDYIICS